jgi:hypothetical protein
MDVRTCTTIGHAITVRSLEDLLDLRHVIRIVNANEGTSTKSVQKNCLDVLLRISACRTFSLRVELSRRRCYQESPVVYLIE